MKGHLYTPHIFNLQNSNTLRFTSKTSAGMKAEVCQKLFATTIGLLRRALSASWPRDLYVHNYSNTNHLIYTTS